MISAPPVTSRLNLASLKIIDGIIFWDLLDLPDYVQGKNDLQYQVSDGDRLDLISNKYYQTPGLDWVIAWANDLELLPSQLNTGDKLIIPDISYIRTLLKGV